MCVPLKTQLQHAQGKKKTERRNGQIHNYIGDFNNHFSVIDRPIMHSINKDIDDLKILSTH